MFIGCSLLEIPKLPEPFSALPSITRRVVEVAPNMLYGSARRIANGDLPHLQGPTWTHGWRHHGSSLCIWKTALRLTPSSHDSLTWGAKARCLCGRHTGLCSSCSKWAFQAKRPKQCETDKREALLREPRSSSQFLRATLHSSPIVRHARHDNPPVRGELDLQKSPRGWRVVKPFTAVPRRFYHVFSSGWIVPRPDII